MPLRTPDDRYIVVRGRLWRASNPALGNIERQKLVARLMAARREVARARRTEDHPAEVCAHQEVDAVKIELGERGPV